MRICINAIVVQVHIAYTSIVAGLPVNLIIISRYPHRHIYLVSFINGIILWWNSEIWGREYYNGYIRTYRCIAVARYGAPEYSVIQSIVCNQYTQLRTVNTCIWILRRYRYK